MFIMVFLRFWYQKCSSVCGPFPLLVQVVFRPVCCHVWGWPATITLLLAKGRVDCTGPRRQIQRASYLKHQCWHGDAVQRAPFSSAEKQRVDINPTMQGKWAPNPELHLPERVRQPHWEANAMRPCSLSQLSTGRLAFHIILHFTFLIMNCLVAVSGYQM